MRVELDVCLATIVLSAEFDRNARALERLAHALEVGGLRVDLDRVVGLGVDVVGARVDGRQGDLVGVDRAVAGDRDEPARLELPGDGAATPRAGRRSW